VKDGPVYAQKRGHVFAALAFVDLLECVLDLLRVPICAGAEAA
jgi:hypothetical protein